MRDKITKRSGRCNRAFAARHVSLGHRNSGIWLQGDPKGGSHLHPAIQPRQSRSPRDDRPAWRRVHRRTGQKRSAATSRLDRFGRKPRPSAIPRTIRADGRRTWSAISRGICASAQEAFGFRSGSAQSRKSRHSADWRAEGLGDRTPGHRSRDARHRGGKNRERRENEISGTTHRSRGRNRRQPRACPAYRRCSNWPRIGNFRPAGSNPCRGAKRFAEHKVEQFLSAEELSRLGAP